MAVTRQEVQAAFDAAYAANEMSLKELRASTDQLKSIDAASPDAQSKFDTINSEYQAVRDTFNNGNKGLREKWYQLDQAWRDAHNGESFTVTQWNAQVDQINQASADRKATKSIKETEIANAKQAAANGGTPGVTANLAPTVNLAASDETKNKLTGSANDDQSAKNAPGKNQKPTGSSNNPSSSTPPGPSNDSKNPQSTIEKPGKRLSNPLAEYPIYTYNISLYMISPEAYDEFVNSGRKTLNVAPGSSTFIIAQSGGVNNTTQQRAPGFTLDYYIDNLQITNLVSAKETETFTNVTEYTFNIVEPYGFSFLSNLNRASDAIKQKSEAAKKIKNSSRQFFILGIRFVGLDSQGNPIQTTDSKTGSVNQFISEKFFDIAITHIRFEIKTDNKPVTYSIVARSLAPNTAFGMKRGIWQNGGEISGSTVGEMLQKMCDQMNQQAKELVKDNPDAKYNTYTFSYVGEDAGEGAENKKKGPLFGALMLSDSQLSKSKLVTSNAESTEKANEVKDSSPNPTTIKLNMAPGTPVLQAFETIITNSAYIESAFKVIKTSADQKNSQNPAQNQNKEQGSNTKIKWYNVSAECTKGVFDETLQDWTWNINYVFQVYETPMVDNAYSNLGIAYYGPYKKYNLLYGGKNSDVISYSQRLDNAYYNVYVGSQPKNVNSGAPVDSATATDAARTGQNNQQKQETLAFVTSLSDPGSMATANVKIMGDPDFLMPDTASSAAAIYNKFYDINGTSVNPNGGQVFVEIDFKEAQDYNYKTTDGTTYTPTNDGLMNLNDKIEFWRYPDEIAKQTQGAVSYMVTKVKSTFNAGKFEQDLTCTINTFPGYKPKEQRETSNQTGTATDGRTADTAKATDNTGATDTGMKPVAPPASNQVANTPTPPTNVASSIQPTVPTKTGKVADDDGLSEVTITSKRVTQDAGRATGPIFDGTNWYDENGNVIPPRS